MQVVHCKTAPAGSFVYIGRPTPAGNPFVLRNPKDDAERMEVIAQYKEWFLDNIGINADLQDFVETLRGRDLGCYCAPRPCHGDVIIEWLNNNPREYYIEPEVWDRDA